MVPLCGQVLILFDIIFALIIYINSLFRIRAAEYLKSYMDPWNIWVLS